MRRTPHIPETLQSPQAGQTLKDLAINEHNQQATAQAMADLPMIDDAADINALRTQINAVTARLNALGAALK